MLVTNVTLINLIFLELRRGQLQRWKEPRPQTKGKREGSGIMRAGRSSQPFGELSWGQQKQAKGNRRLQV